LPYTPPAVWVETLDPRRPGNDAKGRFHTRDTCEHIDHPDRLRPVDKPYSAARRERFANRLDAADLAARG
jgi:hypothetical protein